MATIRESLKKLVEVAKPVPGDEQEFVAKHVIKVFDPQGKDAIHPESPYELILKNVAAVKAPPHAGEDHGHEAPGESEAAYHIPESRDAKIAKLSEMMGKDEDEEDEEEEEDEDEEDDEENEKEMKEAKDVVGVKMHYHNPKTGEKFHEVHFTVPAAEKFRKQHEKAGFKLVKKEAQMAEAIDVKDPKNLKGKVKPFVSKSGVKEYLPLKGKVMPPEKIGEEMKPLLPKQKEVAKKILDKDMANAKADRAAKKQAGTMRKESFRKNVAIVNESLARLIVEDEEGKAKAITAASDMVNDFTSWMQRVGNYQTKSMIELADSIRANFGQQEAETFKQAVGPALAATLETLTQQREIISNAVAVLAGEAAPEMPMGQEPMPEPGIDAASPDEMNPADELDAFAASDAAAGAGTTGRDVRESVTSKAVRMIAEQHNIIARLAK